jgi:prophage antirepressor-like protein
MNELVKITPQAFLDMPCRITDNKGNPWFVVKNVAEMLGIKYYRQTLSSFPKNEKSYIVSEVYSNDGTLRDVTSDSGAPGKSRARKTQKVLIINESGLYRLIFKSRKKESRKYFDQLIHILVGITKRGPAAAPPRMDARDEKSVEKIYPLGMQKEYIERVKAIFGGRDV